MKRGSLITKGGSSGGARARFTGLRPQSERAYPYIGWEEAEYKILGEFMSKARMHMDPAQIPEVEDRLGWLAIIQHYGAPTRLLDFTYSPYVALYFALRNRKVGESKYAEVWGIDEAALRKQAAETSRQADKKIRERKGETLKDHSVSFMRPEDFASSLQQVQDEEERWDALIRYTASSRTRSAWV
jgi:FRG domain